MAKTFKAVEQAIEVLDALGTEPGLSVTEIARRAETTVRPAQP